MGSTVNTIPGARGTPVTAGVYQEQFKGCGGGDPGNPHNTAQNAYICKLSPDGSRLVWASFFGIDHLHRDLALDKHVLRGRLLFGSFLLSFRRRGGRVGLRLRRTGHGR